MSVASPRRRLVQAAIVALAAVLLYAPSIGFSFAYDDDLVVLHNPLVAGERWLEAVVAPYHTGADVRTPTGLYRPLTTLSLAADHAISGDAPWSYHLTNVLLHAAVAVAVLLFGLALGLSESASLVGALLFAVHPVHVEAVANVSGRAELLSALCGVGAIVAYVRMRDAASALTRRGIAASCGLFGLALLAKENAATLVVVAAAWEALRPGGPPRARTVARNLAPLAAVALAYLALRYAVLGMLTVPAGSVTPIENPVVGLAPLPRLLTALAVAARAAALLITPVRLAPDYGFAEIVPVRSLADPGAVLGAVLLAGACAGALVGRRKRPAAAFLVAFVLLTWAIVSNLFVTIGTVLGDRLLYLPSAGVCLLGGAAFSAARARFRLRRAAAPAAVVLLLLAVRAGTYESAWRNDATLFAYAARVTPQSVRALGNHAEQLAIAGRLDEARAVLDRALAIAPDVVPLLLNRAEVRLRTGDRDGAIEDLRRAAKVSPGDPVVRDRLEALRPSENGGDGARAAPRSGR